MKRTTELKWNTSYNSLLTELLSRLILEKQFYLNFFYWFYIFHILSISIKEIWLCGCPSIDLSSILPLSFLSTLIPDCNWMIQTFHFQKIFFNLIKTKARVAGVTQINQIFWISPPSARPGMNIFPQKETSCFINCGLCETSWILKIKCIYSA